MAERTGGDQPTEPAEPEPGRGGDGGRRTRSVGATLGAALIALASVATWYIDHRAASLDAEQETRNRNAFVEVCNDPVRAAALVMNTPSLASTCPTGLRHLLSISADEVDPGPELLDAYLDRLFTLLGARIPSDVTPYLNALHRDGVYSTALNELHRNARQCEVLLPTGTPPPATSRPTGTFWDDWQRIEVAPQPRSVRVTEEPDGHVVVMARVVDTTPACLTRPTLESAPPPRYVGTTALTLSFGTGTGPSGERVWLLDRLDACPARPDPLAAEPVVSTYSLTRRRSIRNDVTDSLFRYAGSTCPAATP
ncbi:hypothetical protein C7C45_26290 [Micromonospora arborensis]|uniref:Uncharacterized protein n=1 Tax=Micromonospora arborensis TaxID=2116518 RepID=A0A318NEQ2_9ACTN|nr:hypothetical protein [Micromonospora arborensis]PYC66228.1 hypothetical protein C7C45_26290 [Micromonospora arborensis]